ncbi:MAG: calcium/sodium antiporter [Patescibacteria group bacterium]
MYLTIALFILGFIFLIKGADILVDGSSSIARRFGISSFFIGLTIVAFGTSTPEFILNILANLKGSASIAFGNIIGANIANTLLILGISALICPLIIKRKTIRKEIIFSLLAVVVVGILANDLLLDNFLPNELSRIDGLILILFFSIFLYYTFGITKTRENIIKKTVGELKQAEPKELSNKKAVLMIILGIAGLVIGGQWILNGAISFANWLGVSEALIGLSIIAFGTTLPELAASVTAAYKGRSDIAIGNIIGSNIFNFFWIFGISAIIKPINFNPILNVDIIFLIFTTILLFFLLYIGKKNILGKGEGVALISFYILYLSYIIYRG